MRNVILSATKSVCEDSSDKLASRLITFFKYLGGSKTNYNEGANLGRKLHFFVGQDISNTIILFLLAVWYSSSISSCLTSQLD